MEKLLEIKDVISLVEKIHYTTATFDVANNVLRWTYKPTNSVRGSSYIITFELDSGSVWFVDSIYNDYTGVYCKEVNNLHDILNMLHSIKDGLSDWQC